MKFTPLQEKPNQEAFSAWLREQGADVLAPTNQWEFARFRAHETVHIIWRNKGGRLTALHFAAKCLDAFGKKSNLAMGFTEKRHQIPQTIKATLMGRDGDRCFFCRLPLAGDITIEHLVAKSKGGPDHTDNLVLAHEKCNMAAGGLPLIEKIKIHCGTRAELLKKELG